MSGYMTNHALFLRMWGQLRKDTPRSVYLNKNIEMDKHQSNKRYDNNECIHRKLEVVSIEDKTRANCLRWFNFATETNAVL